MVITVVRSGSLDCGSLPPGGDAGVLTKYYAPVTGRRAGLPVHFLGVVTTTGAAARLLMLNLAYRVLVALCGGEGRWLVGFAFECYQLTPVVLCGASETAAFGVYVCACSLTVLGLVIMSPVKAGLVMARCCLVGGGMRDTYNGANSQWCSGRPSTRPVLKHGPRRVTCAQVNGRYETQRRSESECSACPD